MEEMAQLQIVTIVFNPSDYSIDVQWDGLEWPTAVGLIRLAQQVIESPPGLYESDTEEDDEDA